MDNKIIVCVPFLKPHAKFLPHFCEWYAANKAPHNLILNWKTYKALHEVQEQSVMAAQQLGATHVLFVEDDHWGFPVDGLEVLLAEDKDAIGFQTFRRSWPYRSLAMKKMDPSLTLIGTHRNLIPHDQGSGEQVQETDVVTWAFTLVKVFNALYEAGKKPFQQWGPVPTDSFFNQYCEDIGIKRHIHFGYPIPHGDHHPSDLPFYRRMEGQVMRYNDRNGKHSIPDIDDDPDRGEISEVELAKMGERSYTQQQIEEQMKGFAERLQCESS